jgi:hypothetical protein
MTVRFRYLATFALLLFPATALATDQAVKPLDWWQVVTGILAVPAAILGLFYSFFQVQKTRLETHKLELHLSGLGAIGVRTI